MKPSAFVLAIFVMTVGCSGGMDNPLDTNVAVDDGTADSAQDTGGAEVNVYAGSASHGDLVVFSVDHAAGTCEVVNETTGQNVSVDFSIISDGQMQGVMKVDTGSDRFYAVELPDKLIAASFDTGNPYNTISFGVSGGTDNMANQGNIPGDYVYIHIANASVNGSTDIKEWGILSIIDDGTWRVKAYATDVGNGSMPAMAPEEFSGAFPVEEPDSTGSWAVNPADHARINVTMDDISGQLTGFAYAPDPNGIFVLDMGTGNGFILALKILPTMTLANLAGEYKYINVWNDSMGAGRSAGRAVINADGTGTFDSLDTDNNLSSGVFDLVIPCPNIQNMFHANSSETSGDTTVELKHYFVLLPYAFMGFNFRTDGGFRFVGYSVGTRL
ncbi:MAG TPA: hypothetical protein PLY68_10820 [Myxococcota bacterium]|nr:hypothetical protein [Myxococcota bacterium]HQP96671.1 hypothetical protein [Myxococcota bacterium]